MLEGVLSIMVGNLSGCAVTWLCFPNSELEFLIRLLETYKFSFCLSMEPGIKPPRQKVSEEKNGNWSAYAFKKKKKYFGQ